MNPLMIAKCIGAALLVTVCTYFIYNYNHMQDVIVLQKGTITALGISIETQNAAVKKLKDESDRKLAEGARALEEAKKETATKTAKAAVIYKTLPAVAGNDCKSALILGNTK